MNDAVNLNRFRKKKRAAEDVKRAADNRVKFGRTKAQKNREAEDRAKCERALDGRELEKE